MWKNNDENYIYVYLSEWESGDLSIANNMDVIGKSDISRSSQSITNLWQDGVLYCISNKFAMFSEMNCLNQISVICYGFKDKNWKLLTEIKKNSEVGNFENMHSREYVDCDVSVVE